MIVSLFFKPSYLDSSYFKDLSRESCYLSKILFLPSRKLMKALTKNLIDANGTGVRRSGLAAETY